ncbi:hypothetical protein [Microbacterium sp. CGR1]|uniref:hypothetical protein n=1 Tax=Microbacterium sp. CGR1 TaxID=1696072 RepID=UPI000AB7611A|nr:hypothetical protein [Microbacterium sp. CGR1]
MSAPRPANFAALADAWDSPIAFATELSRYYAQLAESGHILPAPDITTKREEET